MAAPKTARQIAILDRGFVFVGDVEHVLVNTRPYIKIHNAVKIRRWGTTGGLGQLAMTGATKETILDVYGEIVAPESALVSLITVKEGVF